MYAMCRPYHQPDPNLYELQSLLRNDGSAISVLLLHARDVALGQQMMAGGDGMQRVRHQRRMYLLPNSAVILLRQQCDVVPHGRVYPG